MVGLSVVLEGISTQKSSTITAAGSTTTCSWQIVNKATMVMKPTSPTTPTSPFSRRRSPVAACGFLDYCFLCKQKLLPGKDIYMYKGEWAFCSVECRCRQIYMDEEESTIKTKKRDNMKPQASTSSNNNKSCTTFSSSSSSSSRSREKAARNGFAY